MSSKIRREFKPPLDSLGSVIAALSQMVNDHPNPHENPRGFKLEVTLKGKLKAFTITEEGN